MDEPDELRERLLKALEPKKRKGKMPVIPKTRTPMATDAPAPRTQALIEREGEEPTARALEAWEARTSGMAVVDVAHHLGLSITGAKRAIAEAYAAIHEDLKENLDLNRQLDLHRLDGMLQVYYPLAKRGDVDSASVTLKCLQQRAKLVGLEAPPDPGRSHPQNVLVWVQNQLPSINKIVDGLPLELPPGAPI